MFNLNNIKYFFSINFNIFRIFLSNRYNREFFRNLLMKKNDLFLVDPVFFGFKKLPIV